MKRLESDYTRVKKAFTLIEVLISVTLLSIVITAIFQIKENSLFFLGQFTKSAKNNEFISLATIKTLDINKTKDDHIYLDKIVDFKDDDIRKILKDIKVNIKITKGKEKDLSTDEYSLKIQTLKSTYKIESKIQKDIYAFKLKY